METIVVALIAGGASGGPGRGLHRRARNHWYYLGLPQMGQWRSGVLGSIRGRYYNIRMVWF